MELKNLVLAVAVALAVTGVVQAADQDCFVRPGDSVTRTGTLSPEGTLPYCSDLSQDQSSKAQKAQDVAPAPPAAAPKEFDPGVAKPKVSSDYYSNSGTPLAAVYHISDKRDLKSAMAALGNVRNHVSALKDAGISKPEVKVVFNGDGLSVLQEAKRLEFDVDGGKLAALVTELKSQGVQMKVCYRTLTGRKINAKTDLFDVQQSDIVPSGVAESARLQSKFGYAVIKP